MARWDVLKLLNLLFLANNCVNYSLCGHYDNYDEYGLESEKICRIIGKTSPIEIKSGAAIVRPKHMFDRWTVNYNVHCKFTFKTAEGDGLFGVIQKMSFRRNETHCIDYVRFKRKDGHKTERLCGLLDPSKPDDNSSEFPRTTWVIYGEFDPMVNSKSSAELETEIFISKKELKDGESLALIIAYTSFTNCSKVDPTKYTSIGNNTCILDEYFCDDIYNCVPGVCNDESKCHEVVSTGTGTKVTVGAVTTLILCFITFVVCLWICKRSQKLCWATDCADPSVCTRPGPLPRHENTVNPPVPTAPMLEVAVPSSVADKDLPPSYDSLFPEQSNAVRA